MSYCRLSTDAFQCDVYCYESQEGWRVHLAALRNLFVPPKHDDDWYLNGEEGIKQFSEYMEAVSKLLAKSKAEVITSPNAGKSFCYATPGDCADALEEFRSEGFRFPASVLEELREEHAELDKARELRGDLNSRTNQTDCQRNNLAYTA